jgi:hypothetical protein
MLHAGLELSRKKLDICLNARALARRGAADRSVTNVADLSNDRGPLDPPTPGLSSIWSQTKRWWRSSIPCAGAPQRDDDLGGAPVTTATANDADCQLNRARPR